MTYSQHRNHMADGTAPVPSCYWCEYLIIQAAQRQRRGEYRKPSGDDYPISLDEFDDLAFLEAA